MITGFHAAFGITCEAVRQVMFGGQSTTVPCPCKEWLYDFHRVKSGPGPECAKSPNASARMNRPGFPHSRSKSALHSTQHFVNSTGLHDIIYSYRKQLDYSRSQRQYGIGLILGRCRVVNIL